MGLHVLGQGRANRGDGDKLRALFLCAGGGPDDGRGCCNRREARVVSDRFDRECRASRRRRNAGRCAGPAPGNWPSYNKTLTSNRFSELKQINKENVGGLKVLCTYDTEQYTGFTSGLLEVNDALIAVTEYDIISLDPTNCRQNWRTH